MYLKLVSHKFSQGKPTTHFSPRIEELNYKWDVVFNVDELEEFQNMEWEDFPLANQFVYLSEFFPTNYRDDEEPEEYKETFEHPLFRDGEHLRVGIFDCLIEKTTRRDIYKAYVVAGSEVYLLNDEGETIEFIDLTM